MRTSLMLISALFLVLACKKTVDDGAGAASERVYVSDENGGLVVVIDAASDEVIARIPVGKRPRGVRVSPDGSRVLVALSGSPKSPPGADPASLPPVDRAADGIGIIDVPSLKLARVLESGQDPELFDVSRDGKTLWASNEETAEASLIDVDSGKVVRRTSVGKEPEGVGIHPDGKHVYVANERDNSVSIFDVASGDNVALVPVCERPRSIEFSPDGQRAFTACEESHSVAVIDAKARKAIGSVDLAGEGVRPMGLAVSADGRELYASGGRGRTVHVIDLTANPPVVKKTIENVGERPWGIGIATRANKLYTANGGSGDVSVIDVSTGTLLRHVAVGGSPWGIAVR
ncbi:MAG TPA: beta-propeller fold lactonase family protein [Polyangiaceae bacterium]|nr:beta-propeller fold lactonase family protein [Polyangiaceae bacterium]